MPTETLASRCLPLLTMVLCCISLTATSGRAKEKPSPEQIDSWVKALSSPQYRTRQLMTLRLLGAGADAIPALELGLREGDLERTAGIIDVLRQLSFAFQPRKDSLQDPAWDALYRVSTAGKSSAASRAKLAISEVLKHRTERAREMLLGAGVEIGPVEYNLGSNYFTHYDLAVPKDWAGDINDLYWLSWMHGMETIVLGGKAIDQEVLALASQMPDIKNLVIRDTDLSAEDLQQFAQMQPLDNFQLVNIPLGDELVEAIKQMNIRRSVMLYGTDVTPDGTESLKKAFPNIEIQCRGRFLGVRCSALTPNCVVSSVDANSAADEGGVKAEDVIIKFGDMDVGPFTELQAAIAKYSLDNKPIQMQVRRLVEEESEIKPKDSDGKPIMQRIQKQVTVTLTIRLKRNFP